MTGRQLRARRTAAGRTAAPAAAGAGLPVPYTADPGNGRGNPAVTALTRLAGALGMRPVITLVPGEDSQQAREPASPQVPAPPARPGRSARFRQAATAIAAALDLDTNQFPAQFVAALAALAHTTGKDLAEPGWRRILDALALTAAHPAAP